MCTHTVHYKLYEALSLTFVSLQFVLVLFYSCLSSQGHFDRITLNLTTTTEPLLVSIAEWICVHCAFFQTTHFNVIFVFYKYFRGLVVEWRQDCLTVPAAVRHGGLESWKRGREGVRNLKGTKRWVNTSSICNLKSNMYWNVIYFFFSLLLLISSMAPTEVEVNFRIVQSKEQFLGLTAVSVIKISCLPFSPPLLYTQKLLHPVAGHKKSLVLLTFKCVTPGWLARIKSQIIHILVVWMILALFSAQRLSQN